MASYEKEVEPRYVSSLVHGRGKALTFAVIYRLILVLAQHLFNLVLQTSAEKRPATVDCGYVIEPEGFESLTKPEVLDFKSSQRPTRPATVSFNDLHMHPPYDLGKLYESAKTLSDCENIHED